MYKIKIGGVQIGECKQQISYPHARGHQQECERNL